MGNLEPSGPGGRLGIEFMRDLERDYRAHGVETISQLRKNEPRNYLRLLLSIAPRYVNAAEHWLNDLTDEQLQTMLRLTREALAEQAKIIEPAQ